MLTGIIRESIDKASTKAFRRDGYLIANLYGKDIPNINCAFKKNEFMKYVKTKPSLKFPVTLGKKEYEVVIQEYQKDPVTSDLVHVDLRALNKDDAGIFHVPVKTTGTPVGLRNKGVLMINKRSLKVKCDAANLPNEVMLNVQPLDVGNSILVRDIAMPEGVEIVLDARAAIVSCIKAK